MALIWRALLATLQRPTIADVVLELSLFSAPLWLAALAGLVLGWAWRPRWACAPPCEAAPAAAVSPPVAAREAEGEAEAAVGEEDLERLWRLVEERDGGPAWINMMERSLRGMSYRAWRRDPETGPSQYRSSTMYENAEPETLRDFFWDDEFRTKNKWDDMLLFHEILEEYPTTGTMAVRWIRKFPFFCSDREYIIGRRIWQSGRTFYCVTKGVPRPSIPRQNKPRRVDLYYSSWCIRPVESARGDSSEKTACEILLFHHEDMGIPNEIAKIGIRQGMWGCVRRIEPGFRAYQNARRSGEPVSHCGSMAQINTKFNVDYLSRQAEDSIRPSEDIKEAEKSRHWTRSIPRLAVVGGAIALACTVDHGLVTKAVIFGVARKVAKLGGRL